MIVKEIRREMQANNNMATIKFTNLKPTPSSSSSAPGSSTPITRSSHGISALSGGCRLVIYGGEHVARTPITGPQSLWVAEKKEQDNGEWRWVCPTQMNSPPARVAHSQAVVGDTVYIFGGRSGIDIGETALGDMWKLDIVSSSQDDEGCTAKWTEITPNGDGDKPGARSFHKMITVGTTQYMFGGCGAKGRLNDLWSFDTTTNKWSNLGCSHMLRGRGGPNILQLSSDGKDETRLAIVAGFAGEETNDGHIFNNGSWDEKEMDGLANLRKRSVCAFGSFPQLNKCIIFGGEVDPSNLGHEGAGGFARDVVILDGKTGALDEVIKPDNDECWPQARGWSDATVGGDKFYLFGGLSGDDSNPIRLDDLWECSISH